MYIEIVPNRNSPPAILLREGHREGKRVIKKTIANLSAWPKAKIEALRAVLKNEPLVSPQQAFMIEKSFPHGHVEIILETIKRIGLDRIISAKRCPQRDLVIAMIAERLVHPCSKLATTRLWHTTTLAQVLDLERANEDDLYAAMDWLLKRQRRIEKKLATRHLAEGDQVLYDVSSSYYEGHHCSLAFFGHDRDGKRGKRIIVYGVLGDVKGRPVAVQVYPGNTGDPTTVPDQVTTLRERFNLKRITLVGDRGMLTQARIKALKQYPGIGWISACRNRQVRELVDQHSLQLSLFDERNIAEISSPDYPGERLIACFNPLLAEERQRKRRALLDATEASLLKIQRQVNRRTKKPMSAAEIGEKTGRVVNSHKMAKHFELTIEDGRFEYQRRTAQIQQESELDGIYVIRTSESKQSLSTDDTVRSYKNLARVEQVFRTIKSHLRIRPIHHRAAGRVRAHIFICILAYYVEWHMRQVLAPLLFDDETISEQRKQRDPVAPAAVTDHAQHKKQSRETADGLPRHSFDTLLAELGTRCRHQCRMIGDIDAPLIYQETEPTPLQTRSAELIQLLPV